MDDDDLDDIIDMLNKDNSTPVKPPVLPFTRQQSLPPVQRPEAAAVVDQPD